MRYAKRKLGTLEVSPVGMGCMGLSHGYGRIPSEEQSIDAIRAAYEAGCVFFDTAEAYGPELKEPGHNEKIVGKAVKDFRKYIVLATKLHIPSSELEGKSLYEFVKGHLLSSLRRLQTDYADLYYLHRVNPEVPVEEVADVMGQLAKEGLIRGWGLSQVDAATIAKAHTVTPVSAVQNIYNLLERDAEAEVIPYCLSQGIGFVPFSPVASGFLSGKIDVSTEFEKKDDVRNWVPQLTKENIAGNQPFLEALERFSAPKGATYAQLALAWMLRKYPNVVPIPGSKRKERILESLGAWDVVFTDEEFSAFEEALSSLTVHGHRGQVEYSNASPAMKEAR